MEYINLSSLFLAEYSNGKIQLKIHPYEYNDGRKPRLPRKSSKRYQLMKDTAFCFEHSFAKIKSYSEIAKYSVQITIFNGTDRPGAADLDNYCKAILDGITSTEKVWEDDRQVDVLLVKREYTKKSHSLITVEISSL